MRDEGLSAEALLRRPVRARGIKLGQPTDLVLDAERMHAVGLDVRCGDETHRFLPLGAARIGKDEITIGSALLLLEEADLSFYRRRGRTFSSLRGRPVRRGRTELGLLRDVVLGADGAVRELVLAGENGGRRVPADPSLRIGERGRASAA
jgi:hypothetical protein